MPELRWYLGFYPSALYTYTRSEFGQSFRWHLSRWFRLANPYVQATRAPVVSHGPVVYRSGICTTKNSISECERHVDVTSNIRKSTFSDHRSITWTKNSYNNIFEELSNVIEIFTADTTKGIRINVCSKVWFTITKGNSRVTISYVSRIGVTYRCEITLPDRPVHSVSSNTAVAPYRLALGPAIGMRSRSERPGSHLLYPENHVTKFCYF